MCATHSISANCDNISSVTNNGQALAGMFSHTGTKLYTNDKMRS